MDKNKVKIELYKSKAMAKFSHYVSGNLYYTVDMEDGNYQFPISMIEEVTKTYPLSIITGTITVDIKGMGLSSDLGTTSFSAEIKASELNRWIGKAIDKGEFIKIV